MTSELKFTDLDGETHVIGFAEHTACGLPIPQGNGWEKTADSVCPDCRKIVDGTDEYGAGELPKKGKSKKQEAP